MALQLIKKSMPYSKVALHMTRVSSVRLTSAYSNNSGRSHGHSNSSSWKKASLVGVGGLSAYLLYKNLPDEWKIKPNVNAYAKSLPVYSADDVAKHSTKSSGIWVSYKDSVYDISKFVDGHPGGEKILLGAGGPIDAFWNMYAVHQTPEVLEILQQYKIGLLSKKDQKPVDLNDPFANEPSRLPVFKINSKKPFNAEPPLEVLTDSYITPNELFYVRNHLPVPKIDLKSYRLEVKVGKRTVKLSLDDLKKRHKPVTITTTIQCAGNRRAEMSEYKTVKGLSWGPCAIGTARWTGVRLRDILLDAGIDAKDPNIKHIQFNGKDDDITKACYGGSIPISKAMAPDGDVILAYKMNGVDIPRDHGYPLRAIVPGYVGARNVKWVHQVTASHEESHSHWQRNDYKAFSPSTTFETADYKTAPSIQEMPVISAISSPAVNATVYEEQGHIEVKGYAWSGGGRDILRVDVSSDGGKTWQAANLTKDEPNADDSAHCWAWTLWNVDVPVKPGQKVELVCKAVDSAFNCQPEGMGAIWNLRGFLSNAWHRIPVTVAQDD
uniref:Sulfite oxidase n=1 Tax=Phallusia mammillata TaxID=59560 RepID=A0A6F9DTD4_9ASCI|nr:sulfite oxidase-like [Phallusia mammillata]